MAAFIALSSFSPLASPFVPAAEAAGGPKAAPRRASTHVTKHKPNAKVRYNDGGREIGRAHV